MLYNVFNFIVVDYIFQIDKFIFCYWYHTQQLYYILCMLHWVQDTMVSFIFISVSFRGLAENEMFVDI